MLAHTCEHGDTSPASHAAGIHALERLYYVLVIDTSLTRLVELVGEDVQHQLRIAFCVDMPMCFEVKEVLQRLNQIGQMLFHEKTATDGLPWH